LASNSLMECLVFARQLRDIALADPVAPGPVTPARCPEVQPGASLGLLQQQIQALRQSCWQVAGVERRPAPLRHEHRTLRQQRLQLEAEPLLRRVASMPAEQQLGLDAQQRQWLLLAHNLQQRLLVAELLMEAALFREESRGGHFREDAPAAQPFWQRHSLQLQGQRIHTEAIGRQ
jgi:L-aspartate oxidase